MEEGEFLALLLGNFGFKPYNEGQPSNVKEDIWKICCTKMPVKSVNLT